MNRNDQAKRKGKIPIQSGIKKESKCFFCKKKGHMKKDCSKFRIWLDKKGTQFSFVCYESNMVNVNHNTWWINFWFYNTCFKYLTGYAKPKEASGK